MKYYIKLITGFRDDQFISIPMQEAHKAYHLFRNPEQRGVFDNGLAVIGSSIKEIRPDWNATMGYNETHKIDSDDLNEINRSGVGEKMKILVEKAKQVSDMAIQNPTLLKLPLVEIITKLPEAEKPNQMIEDISKKISISKS